MKGSLKRSSGSQLRQLAAPSVVVMSSVYRESYTMLPTRNTRGDFWTGPDVAVPPPAQTPTRSSRRAASAASRPGMADRQQKLQHLLR